MFGSNDWRVAAEKESRLGEGTKDVKNSVPYPFCALSQSPNLSLRKHAAQVGVWWTLDAQISAADVVHCLAVHHHSVIVCTDKECAHRAVVSNPSQS